jgi:hypothetical protein
MLSRLINWLEKHQQVCPFKQHYGFDCLGCGAQRALILLLKGEFTESIITYPGLIPIIFLIILYFIQLISKSGTAYKILKIWLIFTTLIIVIGYIIKIINL